MDDFNIAINCIESSWNKPDIMKSMDECITTFENKRKKEWDDLLELLDLFEME